MDKIKQLLKKIDGKTFSLNSAIRKMEQIRREYVKLKKKELDQIEMDLKFE